MQRLRGGAEAFVSALDEFFHAPTQTGTVDMTGNFGGLSLGNEPTMHVPYLYSMVGQPFKTQKLVDTLVREKFSDTPDGLPGNDDLGQMSAWIVFSMLGFYPVNPCSGEYALGRPFIDEAVLQLENNSLFIKVFNQGRE